jgi:hypothetical protein
MKVLIMFPNNKNYMLLSVYAYASVSRLTVIVGYLHVALRTIDTYMYSM